MLANLPGVSMAAGHTTESSLTSRFKFDSVARPTVTQTSVLVIIEFKARGPALNQPALFFNSSLIEIAALTDLGLKTVIGWGPGPGS
jgi:hypothetical protein